MHSLFEEQITREQVATFVHTESHGQSFAEALTYFPSPEEFHLGPDEYLEQLRRVKEAVDVPVIGSLNGSTLGGWLEYAKLIEQAGADALELNVYHSAATRTSRAPQVEQRTVEIVQAVQQGGHASRWPSSSRPSTPRSPTSPRQLDEAGADGLVLFNRFYQPDIDVEELEVRRNAAPVELGGAAAAAALARDPVGRSSRPRSPSPAASTPRSTPSRRSWPAPTRSSSSRALLKHGPQYLAHAAPGARAVARGARVRVARGRCRAA